LIDPTAEDTVRDRSRPRYTHTGARSPPTCLHDAVGASA